MGIVPEVGAALLEAVFRGGAYTGPSRPYLGLLDDGREITGVGYRRERVDFSPASVAGTANTGIVRFPPAPAAWGPVSGLGVFTVQTGGSMVFTSRLADPLIVDMGDRVEVAAGGMTISIEDES